MTNLESVYGSEVTLSSLGESEVVEERSTAVRIPNVHILVYEYFGVRAARDKPELVIIFIIFKFLL